jgi:methionyl-tRNA synthetase
MDAMRFRPAAFALRSIWTLGNQYLDRCAPWHETDSARVACILRTAINLARIEAIVSSPFVPFGCARLAGTLGLEPSEMTWPGTAAEALTRLAPGRVLHTADSLFPRIGDRSTLAAWVAEMETRFGGPS